ncbi:MFS family permease [Methylobacterium sp. OAE515]
MAQVPPGSGAAAQGSSTDGLPPRERVLAMAAVGLAMTMAVLDGAIVNVALPVMAKDLAVKPADAIFVVNAYQIAVTASLLPLASLGDIFGFRKVYLPGLAIFVWPHRLPARSRRACRC